MRQRRPATWQDRLPRRLSTIPQPRAVHNRAGVDQRVSLNYPQICAQGVILAGQGLQVGMSQGRQPAIPHPPARRGRAGGDRHPHRLLAKAAPARCSQQRPGPCVGPTLGGTPTCQVWQLPNGSRCRKRDLSSSRPVLAWPWPNHRRRHSAAGSAAEVAQCSMCGMMLPLGLLVPDGGRHAPTSAGTARMPSRAPNAGPQPARRGICRRFPAPPSQPPRGGLGSADRTAGGHAGRNAVRRVTSPAAAAWASRGRGKLSGSARQ